MHSSVVCLIVASLLSVARRDTCGCDVQDRKDEEGEKKGAEPEIPPEAQDLTVFVQSLMEQMVRSASPKWSQIPRSIRSLGTGMHPYTPYRYFLRVTRDIEVLGRHLWLVELTLPQAAQVQPC